MLFKENGLNADSDIEEISAEAFLAAFERIKDPEVRASIIALVSFLADTADNFVTADLKY
jgi:hypothetical protein